MGLDFRKNLPAPSDRFESHEARDRRLQDATSRFAREHQVGWPIVAGTVALAVFAIAMVVYLVFSTPPVEPPSDISPANPSAPGLRNGSMNAKP
jgi:hypothetical protein